MSFTDKHFLVVDDYESMRVLVGEQLKDLGIKKITFASSGNEAIKKIAELEKSDPIQFVITDLVMEDGNGIELAKSIRLKYSKQKLPILMLTSRADVTYVVEAVQSGVNAYLVKPWTVAEVSKKLSELSV